MTVLDLGPGKQLRGDVGLDAFPMDPRTIRHRLTDFPYPFADSTFDRVIAFHVLEHIPWSDEPDHQENLTKVMLEVHRILKGGGVFEIEVPHIDNPASAVGIPTHRRWFNEHSLLFYAKSDRWRPSYAGDAAQIFETGVVHVERRFPYHWFVKDRMPRLYRALRRLRIGWKDAVHVELGKAA